MRISRKRFKPKAARVFYLANEFIRFPELRVIDDEGGHYGIMTTADAMAKAKEMEMDLVVIQPKALPPVAKIVEFGKYKYEKEKEAKLQKAKLKTVDIKGIRLSARIGDHDIAVRKEQAKKFLEGGDKVKVEIILRGREHRHVDIAHKIIQQFMIDLAAEIPTKIEQPIMRQGAQLTSIVTKA